MSPGVGIWRCRSCRTAVFPQRLLCPHCHGQEFDEDRVHEGVVEEISTALREARLLLPVTVSELLKHRHEPPFKNQKLQSG